jgi:hypothetical protein
MPYLTAFETLTAQEGIMTRAGLGTTARPRLDPGRADFVNRSASDSAGAHCQCAGGEVDCVCHFALACLAVGRFSSNKQPFMLIGGEVL